MTEAIQEWLRERIRWFEESKKREMTCINSIKLLTPSMNKDCIYEVNTSYKCNMVRKTINIYVCNKSEAGCINEQ